MPANNKDRRTPQGSAIESQGPEVIAGLVKTIESEFPGSRTGVVIVQSNQLNPERGKVIIDQGETKSLMYAASIPKIAWIAGALHVAKKNNIPLHTPVIPLDQLAQKEIRAELDNDIGRPDISVRRALSLQKMTNLTLGLSANAPLGVLKNWISKQTAREAADVIQDRTEEILKNVLGRNEILWTTTGSKKAEANGIWNCASLEELLTFFRLIANGDQRLELSQPSIQMMQRAIEMTADRDIELGSRLQRNKKIRRVFGKSGYWPYTEAEDIPKLATIYRLGPGMRWLMHLCSVERIEEKSGTNYDVGLMVAIPNNLEQNVVFEELQRRGENSEFTAMKRRAADIVSGGIAGLFQ